MSLSTWRGRHWASDVRLLGSVLVIITAGATLQKLWTHHSNNFSIYRASFWNLLAGRNLYLLHPAQHLDHFKYSPTFALLFAPFALPPEWIGALTWNLTNVFALSAAISFLPLRRGSRLLVFSAVAVELLISVQNFQSNALVAALIIATFLGLEKSRLLPASLAIVAGASIKIFGGAGALFFLLYPRKLRFLVSALGVALLFVALPLVVTSGPQLWWQYQNWLTLLRADYAAREKLSLMSLLHAWFGLSWPNAVLQLLGLGVLLLPFCLRPRHHFLEFRLRLLASLLIFVVIFNHKAESPMFIIAMSGIGLWFVLGPPHWWRIVLLALAICLTSLVATDLVPRHWREAIVGPFVIKAIPSVVIWLMLQFELWSGKGPASSHPG